MQVLQLSLLDKAPDGLASRLVPEAGRHPRARKPPIMGTASACMSALAAWTQGRAMLICKFMFWWWDAETSAH